MLRHDPSLLGRQTMPGKMGAAPVVLARYETPRTQARLEPQDLDGDGAPDLVLAFRSGTLRSYDLQGELLWRAPGEGITYVSTIDIADLDGDGRAEIVLKAGNPGIHAPAIAVLDAERGELRCAIPYQSGAYGTRFRLEKVLPDARGRQIIMVNSQAVDVTSGKPGALGGATLWSFEEGLDSPRQCWSFEPAEDANHPFEFLAFMSLPVQGRQSLLISSWSSLHVVDLVTGECTQALSWMPEEGVNRRHYGWNEIADLDGDGDLDYACLTGYRRVDVIRNEDGRFVLGWTKGWAKKTVVEQQIRYARWPASDVDGDGVREIIFSVFNEDDSGTWKLYCMDSATGLPKATFADLIPRSVVDLDGDGGVEIIASRHAGVDYETWDGVELLRWSDGQARRLEIEGATGLSTRAPELPPTVDVTNRSGFYDEEVVSQGHLAWVEFGDAVRAITLDADGEIAILDEPLPPEALAAEPDLDTIPNDGGTPPTPLLVADVDADGRNEIVLGGTHSWYYFVGEAIPARNPAPVLELRDGTLAADGTLPGLCPPVVQDLDGDGVSEIVVADRDAEQRVVIGVLDTRSGEYLWQRSLQGTDLPGFTRTCFTVGRFRGTQQWDIYVFFLSYADPSQNRAAVLSGADGATVWERRGPMDEDEYPEYPGPYVVGLASVHDLDEDGADDLAFTTGNYLAGLSGRDGSFVREPRLFPHIMGIWGGHASPVFCPQPDGPPVMAFSGAWSTTGAMALGAGEWPATPIWAVVQESPEWRSGSEAFFRDEQRPGQWCVVWPDTSGILHCREVESGARRWTHDLRAEVSNPAIGDIDGDGRDEIVLSGSDGRLLALRDAGDRAEVVWVREFDVPLGPATLADVNGDGSVEILLGAADGALYVLGE